MALTIKEIEAQKPNPERDYKVADGEGMFLIVGGCAPKPDLTPLDTPSGKAELHIDGVTQQQVIDGVIEGCSVKGLTIESQTNSTVVCGGMVSDFKLTVALNYQYGDGQITSKAQYMAVKDGSGVKLMLPSAWYEIQSPFGAVKRVPAMIDRGQGGLDAMTSLERVKARILGKVE